MKEGGGRKRKEEIRNAREEERQKENMREKESKVKRKADSKKVRDCTPRVRPVVQGASHPSAVG